MNFNENTENLAQDRPLSVTDDMVKDLIAGIQYVLLPNKRSTLCIIALVNGHEVHGISSETKSFEYDQQVGRITAYKAALLEVHKAASILLAEKTHQEQLKRDNVARGEQLFFIHHKGGAYKLLNIAKDKDTLEEIAVYQSLLDGAIYTRPASEFYAKFKCAVDMPGEDYERLLLQEEYNELMARYKRLEIQLGRGQPEYISDNQWWLLKRQLAPMREYHEVLSGRIIDMDQTRQRNN